MPELVGGLPHLILKFWDLLEAFLDRFVSVYVEFATVADGQTILISMHSEMTEKGTSVMDAVATIVHQGLVFVAQLVCMLPAQAPAVYGQ